MRHITHFIDNCVAQPTVAAKTGLGLVTLAFAKMVGNLQVVLGQETISVHALKLNNLSQLSWIALIGLSAVVMIHIAMTVRLHFRNRAALEGRYATTHRQASTTSSKATIAGASAVITMAPIGYLYCMANGVNDHAR